MPEYKNPQSEPGMEQRFLLVFLLMAVVIFGSQLLMRKYMPQPPPSSAHPSQPAQPAQNQSLQNPSAQAVAPSAAASIPSAATTKRPASAKEAESESETVI